MNSTPWPALRSARAFDAAARVPFYVGEVLMGSVPRKSLEALRSFDALAVTATEVVLVDGAGKEGRTAALAPINQSLRTQGLIAEWHDQLVPLRADLDSHVLGAMERGATRFWGTMNFVSRATGYLIDRKRKASHLWFGRRSMDRAIDPGRLDTLISGTVQYGSTLYKTLHAKGIEQASLNATFPGALLAGSVIGLMRDLPTGLQNEWLQAYDLKMPAGVRPVNRDGYFSEFVCLTYREAMLIASRGELTADAELVTLDFGLRHDMVGNAEMWQSFLDPALIFRAWPVPNP